MNSIINALPGILYFIITLGIIVAIHELGHLVMAKKNGVFCHEFSIGMGPRIWKFYQDKQGTEYNIRLIPIGGYVRMAGENTGDEADEKIPANQKLDNKTNYQKLEVLIAGIVMNFLLALLLYIIVVVSSGTPDVNSNKVEIVKGTPIAQTEIKTGDKIVAVDSIKTPTFTKISEVLTKNKKGTHLIEYQKSNTKENKLVKITPKDGTIGIKTIQKNLGFFAGIKQGFSNFVSNLKEIFQTIGMLINGDVGIKDLSGPVGIAGASITVSQSGFISMLLWVAFLSLNLGVMNLLPIPALDGGRMLFVLIEIIIRRKINAKVETFINTAMFLVLIGFMIFVTFQDIARLFNF